METKSLELWSTDRIDLVEAKNGQAVTSSLVVADYFRKAHKDVLKAIKLLDCSVLFNQRNFAPVEYRDKKGENRPMYYMTRDGFTFLAMGFAGKEKSAYFCILKNLITFVVRNQTYMHYKRVEQRDNRKHWQFYYSPLHISLMYVWFRSFGLYRAAFLYIHLNARPR